MNNQQPVVLIYKRTHTGDPNSEGIFGINDCMGHVRNRKYEAVIGIGGKQPCRGDKDIAYKINWIGIGPTQHDGNCNHRGVCVTFDKFCLYDEKGSLVKDIAPNLYTYMYEDADRRVVMSTSLPLDVYEEVVKILELAEKCPPSRVYEDGSKILKQSEKCPPCEEIHATNKKVDKCG